MSHQIQIPKHSVSSLKLENVWSQRQTGDILNSYRLLLQHASVASLFLMKSKLTSLLSILSIAMILVLLGLIAAFKNADFLGLNMSNQNLRLSIFMLDQASESDWINLETQAKSLPDLKSFERLSKKMALEKIKTIFIQNPDLFVGLETDNPLPASLELVFDVRAGDSLEKFAQNFRIQPGVEQVAFDGELAKIFSSLGSALSGTSEWTFVGLIVLTIFLIATTVRLSMFHEGEQIEIMGLVGASSAFIQAPFVLSGALQALAGFILSGLTLWGMDISMREVFQQAGELGVSLSAISIVTLPILCTLAFVAVGAGVIGSYLSSRQIQ
jgi:cell division transport system permease protein